MSIRSRRVRSRRAVSRSKQLINSCVELLEDRTLFSFGLTTTTNSFVIDTGANLVFSVLRNGTSSTIHSGDITSMTYNGTELEAPFNSPGPSRFSHYESGLTNSTTTVTASVIGDAIVVACNDLTGSGSTGVIQYYIAHKGENNIYMAQYAPGPSSPSPGEMRFITYLNWNVFTNHPSESDTTNASAIESTDVSQKTSSPFNTVSKYYGEHRFIDEPGYWGATGTSGGNSFGAFMYGGNRETSSGGPFYKDIDFQSTGQAVELYNYTFSGHSQTENFRTGLKGPFVLQFTDGSAPTAPDYSFIDSLPVTGLVPASGRGAVSGVASGAAPGLEVTVGLSNAADQYWAHPDVNGNYTISGVLPGTYTETLYQGELAVGTKNVTVTAGNTTSQNIASTRVDIAPIFRIGTWDGTPIGFENADKIQNMHPSDPRMSPWVNNNYVVGTSTDADWPMAEWKNLNGTADSINTITFNLTAQQVQAMQFRIGITTAQANGRPIISVNNGSFSSAPAISPQPSTRNITVGNWRGNNFLYTYNVSAASLHAGTNNIRIEVASGSSSTSQWLEPTIIYDAVDLLPTTPFAPTGLVANAVSDHEIDLVTWNASAGATSYNVKRSTTSGGLYTTIATNVTTTSYPDPTLDPGTYYYYVVSAVNAAGESSNSGQSNDQTFPAAPTNLMVTAATVSHVDLSWDSTFGASFYTIKRSDTAGGPYTIVDTTSDTTYSDTTVQGAQRYFYVVSATDNGGEGDNSDEAVTTTPPVATSDSYSVEQNNVLRANDSDGSVDGTADDSVLLNDLVAPGNSLAATLVTGPAHGLLVLQADGTFKYTPNEDYIGGDSFTYIANDGYADSNVATVQIDVEAAAPGAELIPDPSGSGMAVSVNGTSGNDSILVNPSSTSGAYDITLNGQLLGTYNVKHIIIHGEAGDDTIQVAGSVMTPVLLFGDGGNDHLNAGNGGSVVVGGSGDDELLGGGGRDVLIGGLGADRLVGNADDDILVAGRTDYDADVDSLVSIHTEWDRTDADFVTRVGHLEGTQSGGLNGTTYLSAATVHDDGTTDQIDILTGSSGDDWYIYDSASGDKATGVNSLESSEAITNI